ncbi:MAG: mevalonate kinase [Chloroflexi bacterium HGW-Chloroflexi-6]|nr:MAG: mevalonate kinase [Chloroflexi bacterium HGW-Chloroflexi-6]
MATASAPGKIILFGEHAVVYGRPALAVPVLQVHAVARADLVTDKRIGEKWADAILVEAPDIQLFSPLSHLLREPTPDPLASVISSVFQLLGISHPPALKITITSTIPVASGLGSGAAVSVAVIRALAAALGHSLSDEQVSQLAYETEKLHHGTPSGIDNTVIAYAKPVYFVRGQPIQIFSVARPFRLVIADTGQAAPTKESVGDVRKLWEADQHRWEAVFDKVGKIVVAAKEAVESGEIASLGPLMDANHALLQEMTVSSPELDRLVLAAKAAGANGAKLSGGGRGGNMIALVQPEKAESVASALKAAGARNTIITTIE